MYSFIFGIILLILGYVVYGKYVEKEFGIDENNGFSGKFKF
jgi:carbon starvation protein CstA